jgi:uncharacterized membrane protein YdfJ with MMPL/SSD domain
MKLFGLLSGVINRLPWVVVGAGIIFASVAGIFGGPVSKSLQSGGFQDPSSQSTQAVARLENATGLRADGGLIALVTTKQGIDSTGSVTEVTKVARVIAAEGDIDHVLTYYETHDPSMVSRDGGSTIVVGVWKRISDQEASVAAARLATALKDDSSVKLGGVAAVNDQLNTTITRDLGRAELIAFPIQFQL